MNRRGIQAALAVPICWLLAAALAAEPTDLDCLITPDEVVELGSQVDGILERVDVDRGDRVGNGQVVAKLVSDVEQATVELARARMDVTARMRASEVRLAFGKRRKERTGELFKKKAVSFHDMDEAETEMVLAELELFEAKENQRLAELELKRAIATLNLRTIRSPLDGIVIERYKSAGEHVENEPVVKLARIDPLSVEVIAPVALFGSIRTGMRAVVTPEVPMKGRYEATVAIVDQVVDAASGTFGVRLELPNPDHRLPGGLKCTIRFPDAKD